MSTQPQTQSKPNAEKSLELLERIAQATEANTIVLQELCSLLVGKAGTTAAPSQINGGQYEDVTVDTLVVTTDDNGKPVYRVKGGKYVKHGVRVWPEVLPVLGIKADELKPGPNPFSATVRVLLKKYTDEETGQEKLAPQKVVGLA